MRIFLLLAALMLAACQPHTTPDTSAPVEPTSTSGTVLRAGFVVTEGVYNSELMAPYDVLHHSIFRDAEHYIEPFVVSPDGEPVTTFEGLDVSAHYSFATAPPIDILVIPSTEHSMGADLENAPYMAWLTQAVADAQYVLTVCDGAFPLAATGVLDGRVATTFPADRDAFADRFPEVDVRYDQRMVVDGKYITSVGGAMSYEPAFYLVEHLYGKAHADRTAQGLVWPWDLAAVPHLIVNR
ncbi:MAG: DJ-1/PfpI family protein [Bacteroidota bacterium]